MFLRIIAVIALLLPSPLFSRTEHHRTVSMGVDFFRGGNMCGGMSVDVKSGDFFQGLESRKTEKGKEFRKKSKIVQSFPEKLDITARVYTGECVGPGDPRQRTADLQRFDADFIKSLRFEGFWKDGFEMKKANIGVFSEGEGRLPDSVSAGSLMWEYDLTVTSTGIPLTDSLILDVLTPEGKVLSRFSATL